MVRYWAHNPGTGKACLGSTPSPATKSLARSLGNEFHIAIYVMLIYAICRKAPNSRVLTLSVRNQD